jgi:hypothetical protein
LKKNQHHLTELGDVIVHHDLYQRYGISLLHKHFDLLGDEVLLRKIDRNRRVAHMRPVPHFRGTVPYLWRAQLGIGGQWQFFPLEFLAGADAQQTQAADLSKLDTFLTDMAEQLARLDLLDVFGIATTNILSIPLEEDEILVETTDAKKRLLTIDAERRADLTVDELTETFWTFVPAQNVANLGQVMKCAGGHCFSHCLNHCAQHCRSHCKQHCQLHPAIGLDVGELIGDRGEVSI